MIKEYARGIAVFTMIILFIVIVFGITESRAEDKMMEKKIDSIVPGTDKNGNEFVRLMFSEDRALNGVRYQAQVPIMFFGQSATVAKAVQPGQSVKMIVSQKTFNGSTTYTGLAIVK